MTNLRHGEPVRQALSCILRKAFAEVRRDALLHNAAQETRQRRRDGNQDPQQHRKNKARDSNGFERDSDAVRLRQSQVHRENVGDQFNPVNNYRSEQKGSDREGADANQKYINRAGNALTVTAVAAFGQMLIIVRAHSRRQTRNIVTPA